ncbi:hypothetical protein JL107_00300 [Nakamurella flavida]|uniref:Antibiotic biosynthesis monooxygenase n=1 Tax=Nakamurella flavida TaxID=363630 RepID=A0A938YFE9_9ACTN|nr:hypothetical protein [Nakamurella flavida]MBM9474877.1 hypothetical protein [Nakamurella flavida]MDP9776447.1 hypothetical protein [Nakamurella flavida]
MFLLVAHFRSVVPGPTPDGLIPDGVTPQPEPRPTDGRTDDLAPGPGAPEGARAPIDPGPVAGDAADRAAVALLAAQPSTRWLRWAGSTEEAGHRVLVAEFASAADYRRALSPFEVRMTVVPWLSGAEIETSGVFEVSAAAGAEADAGADADADAGPTVPGDLRWSRPTVTDPGR